MSCDSSPVASAASASNASSSPSPAAPVADSASTSRNFTRLIFNSSVSTKETRSAQVMAREVGSLPCCRCSATSSVSRVCRVYFTVARLSSGWRSSHSRSMLNPVGA